MNADIDTKLNLVARKFFNNDTEVVSFYEPSAGHVIAIGAGHPTGPAMLKPSRDPEVLWGKEAMPQPLVEALARQAAGVGLEHYAVSHQANAPESLASSVVPESVVPAPANEVKPLTPGTGYCDTQWFNDFPPNMTGTQTSYCQLTNPVSFPPAASNGAVPQFVGAWNTSSNQARPYGGGCDCSCRNPVGFQEVHFNPGGINDRNEWENFGNMCPVLGSASVTVTASNENFTFGVPEDFFSWVEDTGTVTCVNGGFFATCASTNDIGNWSMIANSNVQGGFVNFISDAYGP
jgi:hypothetical protein